MKDITLKQLQKAIKKIDGLTIGDSKMSDWYFMKFIEEVGELSECITGLLKEEFIDIYK